MKRVIADGSNATAKQAEAAVVRMMDACMKLQAKACRLDQAIDDLEEEDFKSLFDSSPQRL